MIYEVFSVYDSKVGAFLPPHFLRSVGEMLRAFETAANDSGHQFCKHAEDYTLFHIGAWDDTKCQFVLKETPVSLGVAISFIKRDFPDLKTVNSVGLSEIRDSFNLKKEA